MTDKVKKTIDKDAIILFWLEIVNFEDYVKYLSKFTSFDLRFNKPISKHQAKENKQKEEKKNENESLRDYTSLLIDDLSERD